jgi:glycosyltransferase involved in cell wall biosynthesis
VIPSQPLSDDWRGKTWACHQGAQAATGDLLLFVDADSWFEPDCLGRILSAYEGGEIAGPPVPAYADDEGVAPGEVMARGQRAH